MKSPRPKRSQRRSPRPARDYVAVSNNSYGKALKGIRIYFEGRRPKRLAQDGSVKFGKHILESLKPKFPRFRWIITKTEDSIREERGITRVRTSESLLDRMNKELWGRTRDIKNDVVRRFFGGAFPAHFADAKTVTYVPGTIAGALQDHAVLPRLSAEDRQALSDFIPAFVASESIGTVNVLKAAAQIKTLRELAKDLEREIGREHAEAWWQTYVKANILLIQQGYIKAFDRLNMSLGNTRFPDFALITHDHYLDILEIKRPNTAILKEDSSRGNFFWDPEVSKAVIQTENYIEFAGRQADALRSYFLDKHKLDAKTLRPRGIILVGNRGQFQTQKQRDDFRLLSHGLKNITVLTYDELLTRLKNYIAVLEEFAAKRPAKAKRSKKAR